MHKSPLLYVIVLVETHLWQVKSKMNKKHVRHLMTDYKRYAFVLLAVSVFLYLGMLIPAQGQEPSAIKEYVMMGTTSVFLAAAFFCFKRSITYKKRLDEQENA
jgi:hypothetical protein